MSQSLDFNIPWTYAECARFLGIDENTLKDRVKRDRGAPPRIKLGGQGAPVRFWPPDVLKWLRDQTVGGNPDDDKPRGRGRPRKNVTAPANAL